MNSVAIRKSYDTSVKHLFRLGLEKVISKDFRKSIPWTNIHRWKNESDTKYYGAELNKIAKSKMDLFLKFNEHEKFQRIFNGYLKVCAVFRSIIKSNKSVRKIFLNSKEQLLDVIQKVKPTVGLERA